MKTQSDVIALGLIKCGVCMRYSFTFTEVISVVGTQFMC